MESDAQITRRDVLKTAAGTLLAAGVPALAQQPEGAKRPDGPAGFEPVAIPEWVYDVTSMAFGSQADLDEMAAAGVQVLHTNLVWPYYPLRRDGGGLGEEDSRKLKELVAACHERGIRLSLGLPPFMPVELVRVHPDWRIHDEPTGKILCVAPDPDNLGTRSGCNLGPWGDYLVDVCGELVKECGVDGFSYDGNYHPPICYCPACRAAWDEDQGKPLPSVNLDDVAYRRYLVWRGERLEEHYRRMQSRIKQANPEAVLMSWTVNAGRYGHLLHSPRAMPARMNRLFDLPMQEWWLDETNFGASIAPAFGAAYLHAATGGRPCASEPYMMSRGNPYGTHSFPAHERLTRTLLALTHGNVSAQSFGWPGHRQSAKNVCREVASRAEWTTRTEPWRWGAMLVSEQTRQFYAYRNIPELFLPHVFGSFRAVCEEHIPMRLINDWDVTADDLASYKVLLLPNAAALSESQADAVRAFVENGGGLVAIGETSLCDELGRPGNDFALADLFGVSFEGRPKAPARRVDLDENFARQLDESYWAQRVGVATLNWSDHVLMEEERLEALVPSKSVLFRGPQVLVSEPRDPAQVACRIQPEGETTSSPAVVARPFGKGKVVYLAAAVDAALWSYSFPYQRRLLARCIEWAAESAPEIRVEAPMCVQTTFFRQVRNGRERVIIHVMNNINTTAHHGLPSTDVPLREETIPISGIRVDFADAPRRCRVEPQGIEVPLKPSKRPGFAAVAELPPVERHSMLVAES